jgi:hypothetical protein
MDYAKAVGNGILSGQFYLSQCSGIQASQHKALCLDSLGSGLQQGGTQIDAVGSGLPDQELFDLAQSQGILYSAATMPKESQWPLEPPTPGAPGKRPRTRRLLSVEYLADRVVIHRPGD